MKNILSVLILIIIAISPAQTRAEESKRDSIIRLLDHTVERRDTYYTTHAWQIDSVKRLLATVPAGDRRLQSQLVHDIFERYKSFQGDSAQVYADREMKLAEEISDPDLSMRARTDKLYSYITAANFTDAVDLVRATRGTGASPEALGRFYFLCIRLYSDMCNFANGTLSDKNAMKSHAYADSVIATMPADSYEAQYAGIFKTMDDLPAAEKIDIFSRLMLRDDIDDSEKAMISSILGDLHYNTGKRDAGIYYKAKSAILDITQAKRETSSMRFLADMMFQDGDYERASKYIQVSLADANFFNAPHRKAEIANVLPLIESQRYKTVSSERTALLWVIGAMGVLFLLLCAALFFYFRAIRRLRATNRLLGEKSSQLEHANKTLRESIKIKDEYIGYGFYANSEYIKKLEYLYKLVGRKLKARQYDDLATTMKESDLRREKEKMLADFDSIFLKLFPTYVKQYEALFPEEERREENSETAGTLTPEMRIFALIRLGIKDIAKIATFLNYSINTVNTYKTRAKNRSSLPNDRFEGAIMEIKSVE